MNSDDLFEMLLPMIFGEVIRSHLQMRQYLRCQLGKADLLNYVLTKKN